MMMWLLGRLPSTGDISTWNSRWRYPIPTDEDREQGAEP